MSESGKKIEVIINDPYAYNEYGDPVCDMFYTQHLNAVCCDVCGAIVVADMAERHAETHERKP